MNTTLPLSVIGFDADDTLWHNEKFFKLSQQNFCEMLSEFSTRSDVQKAFLAIERRNLKYYGFGIKGFILSMIETAIDITDGRAPVAVLQGIIELGREMLSHPIELLPGVRETIKALSREFKIVLITKGDLLDQERKLAQSGLGDLFDGIEIASDKNVDLYHQVFGQYCDGAEFAMMVGNSIKSDINPALQAGAWAIYVPHDFEWEYEKQEPPQKHPRFHQVSSFQELIPKVKEIQQS